MADEHDFIVFALEGPEAQKAFNAAKEKIAALNDAQLLDSGTDALLVRATKSVLERTLQEFEPHLNLEENKHFKSM